MDKNLESQLNELMIKNQKKFTELIEKASHNFREKFNKDLLIKNKEKFRILDGSTAEDYFTSLEIIEFWIDKSIDDIRNYIKPISYPLFVYLYLELIQKDLWEEAKSFFEKFSHKYISFKEELENLCLLKEPLNYNTPFLNDYLKNKIHIYAPKTIFDFFIHFLNTNNLILILDILNKYFERSNILSKLNGTKDNSSVDKFVLLNLTGEEVEKINSRTSIYYNKIKRDNEILNKSKGRGAKSDKNILSKVLIPIPELYFDNLPLDNTSIKLNRNPNIGCYTLLNTHNKMNCADMTIDGGIIACGFKDGTIMIWIVDKEIDLEITDDIIKKLEEFKEINYSKVTGRKDIMDISINKSEFEKVDENDGFIFDEIKKRQRKYKLCGHTDSIFSVSISPDKRYIISGSYDESIRLWSIHTRNTLVIFKGHFAPVLSVKFSPFSHYFASGGSDRSAKLWAVSSASPLRHLIGHLSDVELVDFHPNALYIVTSANDRTIRLWASESGECVRIFFNYSNKTYIDCITFSNSGKIMAVGCDRSIVLYDLIKMGDPIRIVENLTQKSILSLAFDNDDVLITVSTEDYKILFYNLHSILNDDLSLKVETCDNKIELVLQYITKKTSILSMKYTITNILLSLGRFDDNDPKIFM